MIRQSAAIRAESQAELEAQRQEVTLMTRAAGDEIMARRALVGVWEARLHEDQERLKVDQARLQQEQIPPLYVQRDEAEQAATQQEVTNAKRDVDLALVQLKTVMGISPASRLELSGSLEYQPSEDLISPLTAMAPTEGDGAQKSPGRAAGGEDAAQRELQALMRVAERQRPELEAATQRVRGAEQESAGIRGAYRPQVSIAAMGDFMKARSQDPFAGVTYGVVASIPLVNGGQRRARVQTAEAEIRRQEMERERLSLQVAQEISSALLNLRAAEQNIRTARAALTAAREEYRVALLRYQSGRSVVVEALDALAARVRAESSEVQALFQYNLERDRLLRAVGSLNTHVDPKSRGENR
jgi:outer membrane protein TolC